MDFESKINSTRKWFHLIFLSLVDWLEIRVFVVFKIDQNTSQIRFWFSKLKFDSRKINILLYLKLCKQKIHFWVGHKKDSECPLRANRLYYQSLPDGRKDKYLHFRPNPHLLYEPSKDEKNSRDIHFITNEIILGPIF